MKKRIISFAIVLMMLLTFVPMQNVTYAATTQDMSFNRLVQVFFGALDTLKEELDKTDANVLLITIKGSVGTNEGIKDLITTFKYEELSDKYRKVLDEKIFNTGRATVADYNAAVELLELFKVLESSERAKFIDDMWNGKAPTLLEQEQKLVDEINAELPELQEELGYDLGIYVFVLKALQNKGTAQIVQDDTANPGKIKVEIPALINGVDVKTIINNAIANLKINGQAVPKFDEMTNKFVTIANNRLTADQVTILKNVLATYGMYKFPTTDPGTGSPGGGGGGGGSNSGATVSVTAKKGGTVKAQGVTITFPANVFGKDFKVTIKKLSDITKLPIGKTMVFLGDVFEITKDVAGDFEKAITITLPFNKAKFDATKYDIAVFWLNETTNEWVKLDNVKADLSEGTASGDVNHFTKFAVLAVEKEVPVPVIELTDIKGHWAEANILKLVEAGAISGYPNKTFRPNNNITRAEFAAVVVKAFKLEAKAGKVFGDTASHWAKDMIATAEANGIVSGYDANKFGPDDQITREQMAAMIVKAAKLEAAAAGKTFTDSSAVSAWAQEAVNTVVGKGVMGGYPDNSFKPQGKATRAEAVTVIVNALK